MDTLILSCRAGFEQDCASEIAEKAATLNVLGKVESEKNTGYVLFICHLPNDAKFLMQKIKFNDLIFTRQWFLTTQKITNLPQNDRISPMVEALKVFSIKAGQVHVEVPDTDVGKDLLPFCRKFIVPLRKKLREEKLLTHEENYYSLILHILFTAPGECYVGYVQPDNCSPFPMGIPRLKFPADAPSRSTLKLEEAFHLFIPHKEWDKRLAPGMKAVDLGASPGGWTYQLVRRSMMVYAVDNGSIAKSLMESGQVKHCREDGFRFSLPIRSNDWLVCDMLEKPRRVAKLISLWLINGWCRETIFNLKLPMKKRYEEVTACIDLLKEGVKKNGITIHIQAKHLYHDREEVTVHIRRF